MAYNQTLMRKMGKIAANETNSKLEFVIKEYYKLLLLLLSKKSRYPSNINTHMHVMGYFKKSLSSEEKKRRAIKRKSLINFSSRGFIISRRSCEYK